MFRHGCFAATFALCFLTLAGCAGSPSASSGTSSPTPTPTPTPPALTAGGATTVYVVQTASVTQGLNSVGNDSLLAFPAGANASTTPSLQLYAGGSIGSFAFDTSGQLYLAYTPGGVAAIKIYAAPLSASSTVSRQITTPQLADALTVDAQGYVYAYLEATNSIVVYSPTASGAATPVRTITGAATGLAGSLTGVTSLAVDSSGVLYAAVNTITTTGGTTTGTGVIAVFAAGANGNVAPTRTIASTTGFGGVAVDASGTIYATQLTSSSSGQVAVFAAGATTVTRTIVPGPGTKIIYGVKLDAVGNLYVVETASGYTTPTVVAVPPSSSGTVSPALTTSSSVWTLDDTPALAVR